MFKNTIKQFLYVTLQEKVNTINILGKYVYCAGGSIARNSGAVNKKLTIQGECVKKQRGKEQNRQKIRRRPGCGIGGAPDRKVTWNNLLYAVDGETIGRADRPGRALPSISPHHPPQGNVRTLCAPTGLRPNFQPVRARAHLLTPKAIPHNSRLTA